MQPVDGEIYEWLLHEPMDAAVVIDAAPCAIDAAPYAIDAALFWVYRRMSAQRATSEMHRLALSSHCVGGGTQICVCVCIYVCVSAS